MAHTEAHGGFWVVSRYEDVAAVARDDATFSSYQELPDGTKYGASIPSSPLRQVPVEMDPPEYFEYSRPLTPWFSPKAAKLREPYLWEVTTFCIDRVIESGRVDLIEDIASPVPAILTLSLLGLPVEDWKPFSRAVHACLSNTPGTPERNAAMGEVMGMLGKVTEVVERRRAEPADDLISHLLRAEIGGEPLTGERLMQIITLVIFGGVDTTTGLIGSALEWLGRHPRERDRLREDPGLVPAAGERLLLSWVSANFDEDAFDRPDEVILDRRPNRHQSFGVGIHRCLGSNYARVEFAVVLEEVLRRMPDYVIDTEAARRYPVIAVVNGWDTLPATFTPGEREGPGTLPETGTIAG